MTDEPRKLTPTERLHEVTETAEWVLHIDVTPAGSWDDVPGILEEIAAMLSDLPMSEKFWSRKDGVLLGYSVVEVTEVAS